MCWAHLPYLLCPVRPFPPLYCPDLSEPFCLCPTLHCLTLFYHTLQCPVVYCAVFPALLCPARPCPAIALHCHALSYTDLSCFVMPFIAMTHNNLSCPFSSNTIQVIQHYGLVCRRLMKSHTYLACPLGCSHITFSMWYFSLFLC